MRPSRRARKGVIGSILKALVGYDGNPEWLRIVVYLGCWLVVGSYVYRSYRESKATGELPELEGVAV